MGQPDSKEDRDLQARLGKLQVSLEERRQSELAAKAGAAADAKLGGEAGQAMSLGFRALAQLLAGIVVGMLIGWQVDRWFSTGPWLMFLFLALGTAAGVFNVVRAAGRGPRGR